MGRERRRFRFHVAPDRRALPASGAGTAALPARGGGDTDPARGHSGRFRAAQDRRFAGSGDLGLLDARGRPALAVSSHGVASFLHARGGRRVGARTAGSTRVGVGTALPLAALHAVGALYVDGQLQFRNPPRTPGAWSTGHAGGHVAGAVWPRGRKAATAPWQRRDGGADGGDGDGDGGGGGEDGGGGGGGGTAHWWCAVMPSSRSGGAGTSARSAHASACRCCSDMLSPTR